jgi:phenylacetate-CoA ligase
LNDLFCDLKARWTIASHFCCEISGENVQQIVKTFYRTLQQTQFFAREQLVAHQRALLEPLLRHARAHVPFYRDSGRLEVLFRTDDTIDWDRWGEIPLLSRKDLQSSPEALTSEKIPESHGKPVSYATSGSTGEPVSIISTPLARGPTWAAARLRDFSWHRIDTSQRLAYFAPPSVHATTSDHVGEGVQRRYSNWYHALAEIIPAGERIDINDLLPSAELLSELIKLRPRYLHLQPTTLDLIVAHDREQRLPELGIDAIFTYGETVTPEFKTRIESGLKTRLLPIYASTECGVMAGSCPHCRRTHVYAELAHVEAISEAGQPVSPGEVGRLIVTPFYNYAMPLIRYDHEDYARLGQPGQCRISLPTLDELMGKQRPPFVFPGGLAIRPGLPTQWVIECLGAKMYQVAQVAEDRCEFRIVPGTMAPSDMRFEEMTSRLRATWWDGLQIEYKILDDLPRRTARSKVQSLVQEMPSRNH